RLCLGMYSYIVICLNEYFFQYYDAKKNIVSIMSCYEGRNCFSKKKTICNFVLKIGNYSSLSSNTTGEILLISRRPSHRTFFALASPLSLSSRGDGLLAFFVLHVDDTRNLDGRGAYQHSAVLLAGRVLVLVGGEPGRSERQAGGGGAGGWVGC